MARVLKMMNSKTMKELNVGAMVRFAREHCSAPGLDYTADWIGIVINATPSPDNRRRLRRVPNFNELEIAWTIHGGIHIMGYDEEWWNKLDYEPFEVINESR